MQPSAAMTTETNLQHLLEQIRAIAQLGLNYSRDEYDLELTFFDSREYGPDNGKVVCSAGRSEATRDLLLSFKPS